MPRAAIASPCSRAVADRSGALAFAGKQTGFSRAQRLTLPAQFEATLSQRALVRSGLFAIHVVLSEQGCRLGLVVPKRYEGLAVRRNAIKRVWREVFRHHLENLQSRETRYDLVVRLLAKPKPVPLSQFKRVCREDAHSLLGALYQKLDRQPPSRPCA